MTTVVVTGATGFIGQNLLSALLRDNAKIYTLQRSTRTKEIPSPVEQLTLADLGALNEDIDTVYHCAGSGVNPNSRAPEVLISGNINFGIDLMDALKSCSVRRFVNLGSCSQYGAAIDTNLLTEDHSLDTRSLYGITKSSGEKAIQTIARERGIEFIGYRIFGVYGPGESRDRLIPAIVNRLSSGTRVPLTRGSQMRDFLYINDVVSALINHPSSGIYNLCSSKGVSVKDVATSVAKTLNMPTDLLGFGDLPDRPDEEMFIVGDNEKLKSATNWTPNFSLQEGVTDYTKLLIEN